MATFCILVAPMPLKVKRSFFGFLSSNFVVAKIVYGLKISFMYVTWFITRYSCPYVFDSFVGVLFIDAMQRMYRITAEADLAKQHPTGQADIRTESSMAARKF